MKHLILLAGFGLIIIFAAYGVITFYDDHLKYGRMWETPAVKPYEKPMQMMEAGVVPFSGGEAMFRVASAAELKPPFPLDDPETIFSGAQKYVMYCAPCHGKNHDGNGTVGQSFSPLPRDLRGDWVKSLSLGTLFKEISYGIPEGRQPALATTIDVPDRWRIIAYIKSLHLHN